MSPKARPVEALSFEDAFREMEGIVEQLEAGQLALETSLALYERGQALAGHCQQLLEQAELRVQQLAPKAGGGYGLQPFGEPGAGRSPGERQAASTEREL